MRRFFTVLVILIPAFFIYSNPGDDSGSGDDNGFSGSTALGVESESSPRTLILETLAQDIETASYYELVAWCRELSLDDSGGRNTLQGRLFAYFEVEPTAVKQEEKEAKRRLEIKSARETEYFTIQEVDENYILLHGDVLVELQENEAIHNIRAQRILFNQTANILTAEGNVEYMLKQGDEVELFKGERLTFNIKTWEGVFFRGGMESEREVDGQAIHFFFLGNSISKLKNDTIVLDKGVITSCEFLEDPHYHIRARKIWVLAPGEWAIWNALLYVGRVPVLYIPFFFYPGEEFFFHPVIGIRDREGNFLQTTTYLIGQKKRKENPLSFISGTGEGFVKYKREIRGLFLREVEKEYTPPEHDEWFLKVLLDVYSRLGGFIGIAGDFSPYFSFQGGIGFSRSLFADDGGYTYLWPDDLQNYISFWNRSWLFGYELPFRYGLDSTWRIGAGDYRLSGRFEFYSDPYFGIDFYNRVEDIDWAGMIGLDEETVSQTILGEKLNLSWELSGQADFSKLFPIPLLKRVSIPYLNTKLYWQSRETDPLASSQIPAVLEVDPSRRFYYPVSLKLPSTSLHLSGELIKIPQDFQKSADTDKAQTDTMKKGEPGKGFRIPPVSESKEILPEAYGPGEEETSILKTPEPKEDMPLKSEKKPFSFLLSYQVRPNMIMEQNFNSTDWKRQSDVEYDVSYTTLETSGFSSLDYKLSVLDNLLSLSGTLLYSGRYRTHFNRSYEDDEQWEKFVLEDYRYTQWELKTVMNMVSHPFADDELFSKSTISYSLNWTFYQYILDELEYVYGEPPIYYGLGPEWNDEMVKNHYLRTSLVYQPYNRANTLSLSAQLPPLEGSFTGKLEFYLWLFRTTVNTIFNETDNVWGFQPLVVQETFAIEDNLNVIQELRFDLEQKIFLKSITSLSLWGFTSSFSAERLIPVYFDEGWKQVNTGEEFLPSYVKASYRIINRSIYLWKNRIQLEIALNTSWSMNIQKFTDNSLDFSLNLSLFIYKFLELSFTSISYNNYTYRYIPGLAEKLDESWVNPLSDLWQSFNFWNINNRYDSSFNLKSISLEVVHHLHDWDLFLKYEGKPMLKTAPDGTLQYEWESSFSILMQWIPIPEMKSNLRADSTGFYLRG